jgi:hypothetical protein
MSPPENANAAPLAREGGAAAKSVRSKNEQTEISFRTQSWQDVDLLTERLHLIADYEDHLRLKIRWAQLRIELGMDVGDLDELVADAAGFKEVCRALSAPSDGRGAS